MMRVLALILALLAWTAPGAGAADRVTISLIQGDNASTLGFEVVREAYRRIGLQAEAELMPNERGIVSANNGDTDADTMRMVGLEAKYSNLVRVAEPVMLLNIVAFTSGLDFVVAGWESLRPYNLCIVRGFKLGETRTEGMQRELPATAEAALRMVKAGHCQIATMGEALWLLVDELKLGPLRSLDPPVESVPLYHYVNARHAGLVPKLADALKVMRKDGTIDRILAADRAAVQAARERNSLRE
jgi:polar amino acid transport system substrate-binding protein